MVGDILALRDFMGFRRYVAHFWNRRGWLLRLGFDDLSVRRAYLLRRLHPVQGGAHPNQPSEEPCSP